MTPPNIPPPRPDIIKPFHPTDSAANTIDENMHAKNEFVASSLILNFSN